MAIAPVFREFLKMPCTIVSNNIPSLELREVVGTAVCQEIGERAGDWKVSIYQASDYPAFAITIAGPNGLRWSWTFFGEEQTREFVQERVRQGIAAQSPP
jgi:hypothetical protein